MLDFNKNDLCTGCAACKSVCPKDAIGFSLSERGFYIPTIDTDLCIHCGRCNSVCPVTASTPIKNSNTFSNCYYAYDKNEKDLVKSTSGGVFFRLATEVLKNNGVVCGCVWNADFTSMHVCTGDTEVVEKMRGSKYVQSNTANVFNEIKEIVKTNKVLFVGTPCQATGLYRIVGDHENLLICALVCEGVPSVKVWQNYLNNISVQNDLGKIKDIHMRSKANGWFSQTLEIHGEKKKYKIPAVLDLYCRSFAVELSINEACMNCPCSYEKLYADMIIGDGWGASTSLIKKSKNKGLSAICICTQKGQEAFAKIQPSMNIIDMTFEDFKKNHMVLFRGKKPNPIRTSFFSQIDTTDIIDNMNQHVTTRKHTRLNKILNSLGLYGKVYTLLYYLRH